MSKNPEPAPTPAPASINADAETFTCPGVPDSSVNTIIDGEAKFQQNIYYQDSWFVRRLECKARAEDYTQSSYMVLAVFGKVPDPSWIPLDEVGAYRGSKEEPFSVEGVEGEGIITLTDNGGGAASFTCGDYYVVTSVFGNSNTVGDVRTNLINLATSMTPWVCQDQPIPGLPGNTPTTLTDLTTTPNSPTPTPPQDPATNSAHSDTQNDES
ncbi:hypothetical protein MANAM107_13270 [Actinomyces capricornis]|uniref:Uncharacterized protein n=2 Tax=Actinomyces capricornis TaxID=2755559 RepID=A0ABM7UJD7_9ACTO|nr:hypothetical protein MANAM107_13270 [Actinomyces capricornis]